MRDTRKELVDFVQHRIFVNNRVTMLDIRINRLTNTIGLFTMFKINNVKFSKGDV